MDFSKLNLAENQEIARQIISEAAAKKFKNRHDFEKFRNHVIKDRKGKIFHNLYFVKAYQDLLQEGKILPNGALLNLIRKRTVRTMSGVAPVTVMTKPFPCPGRCIYCPTDVRMPKSYLPSQPAAQRAFRQRFNPYTQVFVRLKAMQMTGHEISKVELRVIGGTFSSYPKRYQKWFLKQCLMALNEFESQNLHGQADNIGKLIREEDVVSEYGTDTVNTVILKPLHAKKSWLRVVKENENALSRCIGINIETRPDFINEKEVRRFREMGITKVEMGVQTTDPEVQKITLRGHDLDAVKKATGLLKDAGFKIGYHMMPNLPGSTPEMDKKMIYELFADEFYQPDYLKIYPCVVLSKAKLADWQRDGRYKSYSDSTLLSILEENLKAIPEYCRIDRIARDIPAPEIESGLRASNIRQILEEKLRQNNVRIREIRYREIKNEIADAKNISLVVRKYRASRGEEYFLSFEDVKKDKLVALLRLRLPFKTFLKELEGAALIREVHVYGQQIAVGEKNSFNSEKQHYGLGRKLLAEAEKFAKKAGYKKIAVISGIGTREYYRKHKYVLKGTYLCKKFAS